MRRIMLLLTAASRAVGLRHPAGRLHLTRRRATLKDTFASSLMTLPGTDELRRAISKDGFVSAKAVDVTRTVREICQLQDCLPLAATALGRAVAATTLVADGLEEKETFQVRFVGDGPLRGVFSVSNGALESRAYVGNPRVDLSPQGVAAGVGRGELQVVRLKNLPGETQATTYSSVVEIKTGEIAEDINYYVATSEQREGALSAGVSLDENGAVDACAGWRVELLPGAPQEVADHLIENIKTAAVLSSTDLLKEGNSCEAILRLLLKDMDGDFDFETREPRFKCTCDVSRVYRTLALLPRTEVDEILESNEKIEAKCEFCARVYSLGPDEIRTELDKAD